MDSRVKNASRNMVFGFILNLYQIFIPFIIRTLMIYFVGMEYLGLNGLFASVLSVLNMAELGVSTAMIYSMYKPVAVNDKTTLRALLKLYKIYYRIIGAAIGIIGLCLMPFLNYLIKSDIPAGINIYILYLMHLSATVLSYWVFAYKRSLLEAYQRTDLVDRTTMVTNTIQYLAQLLVVILTRNYYIYVLTMLSGTVLTNVSIAMVASKKYPDIHPEGEIDDEEKSRINQRIKDIFTAKFGGIIYGSADTIVISAFLGLRSLAVYDNYMYIMNSISGFIAIVFTSVTASVGNSLVLESKEKNYEDFNTFHFIIFWISGMCSACFMCLYEPFMTIWTIWAGEDLSMSNLYVMFLVLFFYFTQFNDLLHLYKNASGIWNEDKYRPLITSLVNLALNFILVRFLGLAGIVISTWLSIAIVGMPWLILNIFNHVFTESSLFEYLKKMGKYFAVTVVTCAICFSITSLMHFSNYLKIVVSLLLCVLTTNGAFYLLFRKTKEFRNMIDLFDALTKGKFEKIIDLVR